MVLYLYIKKGRKELATMSVYAVSDLHGCLDTYYKIKKLLKPEDKVYCLGDCGDRGPEPWATIKSVYQDPQFIYLKGNHEDMLTKASWESLYHSSSKYQRLLAHNGGYDTLLGLLEEKEPLDWISKLEDLPTSEYYINKKGQKIF